MDWQDAFRYSTIDHRAPLICGVKQAVDEVFGNKVMLGKDRLWIHKEKDSFLCKRLE
jgi:hypothetical protein